MRAKWKGKQAMTAHHTHHQHHEHPMPDTGQPSPHDDHGRMRHGGDGAASHGDHSTHAGHSVEAFRQRFWIALILSIPVILYSEMVQDWFGFRMPELAGSDLVAPVLGTVVFVQGGWVFLEGGWREIQRRQPGMMLLISLAIIVAFGASLATTIGWLDLEFWWELVLLITIMLLGHWLEMRAIAQAEGALDALAALLPDTAERIDANGAPQTVSVDALHLDDVILVRPGASVPVDGRVVDGTAELDESMLTGESRPVPRGPGDVVVAGSVVSTSALRIQVTAVGDQTQLAGIQRLVADAQVSKSGAQVLADRFAAILFYVALGAGVITFLVWSLLGDIDEAITRTVTVLVISCPHALGLAIPLVVSISTSLAARNGMLVRDRMALERMRLVSVVLFDKTGTLTEGRPEVSGVATADANVTEQDLIALAAAAEADSEHPLARAVVDYAASRHVSIPRASDFQAIAGHGVQARVGSEAVQVGGPAMLAKAALQPPPSLAKQESGWAARGATILHVVRGGAVVGALALTDTIRAESREAMTALRRDGVEVAMMTGDSADVAQAVANDLGITQVMAGILPDGKQAEVIRLQQDGNSVAMVGDGVNDAPALAQADVGIAIGAGTDVAIASAGVVLASSDPRAVVSIRTLSSATYRKMTQNLAWAVGYNVIAIPLAAGVLAWAGVVVGPAIGAVMMSLSTIIVALNAQLLRRLPLQPAEVTQ
jgi:Cu2+-exporting ATPase